MKKSNKKTSMQVLIPTELYENAMSSFVEEGINMQEEITHFLIKFLEDKVNILSIEKDIEVLNPESFHLEYDLIQNYPMLSVQEKQQIKRILLSKSKDNGAALLLIDSDDENNAKKDFWKLLYGSVEKELGEQKTRGMLLKLAKNYGYRTLEQVLLRYINLQIKPIEIMSWFTVLCKNENQKSNKISNHGEDISSANNSSKAHVNI